MASDHCHDWPWLQCCKVTVSQGIATIPKQPKCDALAAPPCPIDRFQILQEIRASWNHIVVKVCKRICGHSLGWTNTSFQLVSICIEKRQADKAVCQLVLVFVHPLKSLKCIALEPSCAALLQEDQDDIRLKSPECLANLFPEFKRKTGWCLSFWGRKCLTEIFDRIADFNQTVSRSHWVTACWKPHCKSLKNTHTHCHVRHMVSKRLFSDSGGQELSEALQATTKRHSARNRVLSVYGVIFNHAICCSICLMLKPPIATQLDCTMTCLFWIDSDSREGKASLLLENSTR